MMNSAAAGATLLLCSTAAAVTLPQAPELGSGIAELDSGSYQCRVSEPVAECRRDTIGTERIADEPASAVVLFYRDGRLVRSLWVFAEARFDALVEQLTQSLGSATEGSELLKAGMGGVFENRYYTWRSDGQVWFVEQFFERITDSGLWLMDAEEFARLQAERDQVRVRGARDL